MRTGTKSRSRNSIDSSSPLLFRTYNRSENTNCNETEQKPGKYFKQTFTPPYLITMKCMMKLVLAAVFLATSVFGHYDFGTDGGNSAEVYTGASKEGTNHVVKKRAAPTAYTSYLIRTPVSNIVNEYRSVHQVSPLVWNQTIANCALKQARKCRFHESGGPYGENIAGSTSVNNPAWYIWYLYGENANYDFVNPAITNPNTKHFTQLVWANTKEFGCAWVEGCPDLTYQLWCEFSPRGNTGSAASFRANVKTADKNKTKPSEPPTHI
ncbi:hypothetical protein TWF694_004611 [Orbilia ellipsospora]|uniref:SCP domain-containing protein n=1 Tax=Orbilia ellipsospora TaxID=2528407 RepID=A0AAV9WY83_9PEZI